jgi:putative ABC transport system ATP-binding protein
MSDTSDTHELTIELRDVVREYRVGGQSVRALDDISLRLRGGQFVSVVGPSGAGKSTLLHLLGALDSPDSGSITFDGDEIGRLTDEQQSEFRHHRVGSSFSSSICCRPCRHGRTWQSRSCSTASGWAR